MLHRSCLIHPSYLSHKIRSLATIADTARARIQAMDSGERGFAPFLDGYKRQHTYLRISLTEKCNLRCTYCMPSTGVELLPKDDILTADEIYKLAKIFVLHGITKIRLTGGEPTIRSDIVEIIERLSSLKMHGLKTVGMTSNGIALRRKLKRLREAGLDNINLSLDTLDPFKFELITRRRGFDTVLTTLDEAIAQGFNVKLNCVVIAALNDSECISFVEFVKDKPIHVRFIEYMPFQDNRWSTSKLVPSRVLQSRIKAVYPSFAPLKVEDVTSTSRMWGIDEWKGQVGFVGSMTDHFCATCDRMRISADGRLKVCLFGEHVLNLRTLLRGGYSDEDLYQEVGKALKGKKWKHDGHAVPEDIARWGKMGAMVGIGNRAIPLQFTLSRITRNEGLFNRRYSTKVSSNNKLKSTSNLPSTLESEPTAPSSPEHSLSHISSTGQLRMSPITTKAITMRCAGAVGNIYLPSSAIRSLFHPEVSKKGDVFTVARIAGIQGAKRTADLVPLCHTIGLTCVKIEFDISELSAHQGDDISGGKLSVRCDVECEGKTGVEMEALVGVTTALATVWDMLKSVGGKEMEIGGIKVVSKSGGRSGDWVRR